MKHKKHLMLWFMILFIVKCNQASILDKFVIVDKMKITEEKCNYSVVSFPKMKNKFGWVDFDFEDTCDKFNLGDNVKIVKEEKK